MLRAARRYDVTPYALVAFGGAGGQHACLVADALGMSKVRTTLSIYLNDDRYRSPHRFRERASRNRALSCL